MLSTQNGVRHARVPRIGQNMLLNICLPLYGPICTKINKNGMARYNVCVWVERNVINRICSPNKYIDRCPVEGPLRSSNRATKLKTHKKVSDEITPMTRYVTLNHNWCNLTWCDISGTSGPELKLTTILCTSHSWFIWCIFIWVTPSHDKCLQTRKGAR